MASSSGFLIFIRESLQELAQRLLEKIPENKRRTVLLLTAGSLVLLIFAMILLLKTSDNKNQGGTVSTAVQWQLIPIEDFFLPEEPDFIPGVLLEREQRTIWTEDDTRVYWQDPLQYGEEIWRGRVDTVIDQFLEHIP